jgi:hypothetical protein
MDTMRGMQLRGFKWKQQISINRYAHTRHLCVVHSSSHVLLNISSFFHHAIFGQQLYLPFGKRNTFLKRNIIFKRDSLASSFTCLPLH